MNMKSMLGIYGMMTMSLVIGGFDPSISRSRRGSSIPIPNPIPFTFHKFRHFGSIPKGCKMETIELKFIKPTKPEYHITVTVDIVYGTLKAAKKKIHQYQQEIGNFIYHSGIDKLREYPELIIEEVIESIQ